MQNGMITKTTNHTNSISQFHKLNLKYLLELPKTLPMENESIANILKNILNEYKTALPEPEPKEVWKDRCMNKLEPVSKRNDIFAC